MAVTSLFIPQVRESHVAYKYLATWKEKDIKSHFIILFIFQKA